MVSIVAGRHALDRTWIGARKALGAFLLGSFLAFTFVHTFGPAALALQTREQCHKCCEAQTADEYYREQCKLKCFRNPDQCMEQKSMRKAAPAAEAPPRQPAPSAVVPGQQPPVSAEAPRPQPKRRAFQWPNPLNLAPGRERDAAAQILAVNGILPQHPQYAAALQAVESVLVNFARANPTGGKLPTAQLENILRQLR